MAEEKKIRSASVRFVKGRPTVSGNIDLISAEGEVCLLGVGDTLIRVEFERPEITAISEPQVVEKVKVIKGPPSKVGMFASWFMINALLFLTVWAVYAVAAFAGYDMTPIIEFLRGLIPT